MTRSRFSAPLMLGATLGVGLSVFSSIAQAQDAPGPDVTSPEVAPQSLKSPSGPSAKMAARLKYAPPNNYLRHYLGDDRYKIAGGVWKLVSTQLDVYYHRASCPNMLKQSPDIVIGFPNKAMAEEGGYRPCTTCKPDEANVLFQAMPSGAGVFLSRPTRLTLADGVSSVTLPAGWRHIKVPGQFSELRATFDVLMPMKGKGKGAVVVASLPTPNDLNGEEFIRRMQNPNDPTAKVTAGVVAGMAAANPNRRSVGREHDLTKPTKIDLGGVPGVLYPPRPGIPDKPYMILTAQGKTFFLLLDMSYGSSAGAAIRKSFKPRKSDATP